MLSRADRSEAIFPYRTFPKLWRPTCPLCVKMPRGWLDLADRYGYRVQIGFCHCGLGWLTEQLTRAGYDALYAGAYRQLVWGIDHPGVPYDPVAEQARLDKDQWHYGKVLAHVMTQNALSARRLLDAGGSCGGILEHLPFSCTDLAVLDPAAHELPVHEGVRGIRGYLEDAVPGEYDGIICARTIDHLTDPLQAFRHMRAACPNGWLLFDFVDLASLPRARRTYPLAVELKIDHPLYWTLNAAKTCLGLTGWDLTWTGAVLSRRTKAERVFCVAK